MPPVVCLVSKKDSGKTTLLEKLIPELSRRGYRLGTVKHDAHGFDIDHEGKDSWRHKQAGAATVVISSPRKIAMVRDLDEEMRLKDIVERFFEDRDLVIAEGYKQSDTPKIELFRSTAHRSPWHTKGSSPHLIAVVSDIAVDLGVPCLSIDDVRAVADFIETRFLRKTAD